MQKCAKFACADTLKQTDHGIKLKENHNYYYQVQGLMGVTGMKW